MESGKWRAESGERKISGLVESANWRAECRDRKVETGKWRAENVKWRAKNNLLFMPLVLTYNVH